MKETFMLTLEEVSQALGQYLTETGQLGNFPTDVILSVVYTQYGEILKVVISDEEKTPLN